MRSRYLASLLSAFAITLAAGTASAQTNNWNGNKINGVPASVTSFGFGGQAGFHGVPASVTSLNFGVPANSGAFRHPHRGFGDGQHHHNQGLVNPFYGAAYYTPYFYPSYVMDPVYDSPAQAEPEAYERSGPDPAEQVRQELESLKATVRDYRDELRSTRVTEQAAPRPEQQQVVTNQPETILVFKDGHQLEIGNYAIVGDTLYDLSEGRTKKVALAELNLPATVKQNDDRGVEFKVPATSN